jgi:hypothetical protein
MKIIQPTINSHLPITLADPSNSCGDFNTVNLAYKKTQTEAGWPRNGFNSTEAPHIAEFTDLLNIRQELLISSRACPKFISCSAPVCPLEANWETQRHLPGERVCRWLREAVKDSGNRAVKHALPYECGETVVFVAAVLLHRRGELGNKLRRASKQGSKSGISPPWVRKTYG